MTKTSKPTLTNSHASVAPFATTTYPQDPVNKNVVKMVESASALKNNPELVVNWAKEHPMNAAGIAGLAVGGYMGYSKMTGEYKIPGYEFNVSENASVKLEGAVGLEGQVKSVGVTFKWRF